MSEYLKIKSTNERQSIRIETRIVEPQTISDTVSGGQATFLLPTSGLLDRGTRIVIPVTGLDANARFPLTAGGFGIVQSATLRDHLGNTICQTNDLGQYMAWYNLHRPNEYREKVQATKTANGYNWEEGTRYRLKGSNFNHTNNGQYNYDDADSGFTNGRFTFSEDGEDSFEVILSLQDLFPELFGSMMLPLGVLAGQLSIQLVWASQKDRAIGAGAAGAPEDTAGIQIDTANTRMVLDLLYFDDDTMARLRAESNKGIPMVYGDLISVKNTLVAPAVTIAPVAPGNDTESGKTFQLEQAYEYDIGLSNLTVRYVICAFVSNELGSDIMPTPKQLLGKYHSLASRKVNGGLSTQLTINNEPHYPEEVSFYPRQYTELQEVHGFPLYVPQPLYSFEGVVWDQYAIDQLTHEATAPLPLPYVGAYCYKTQDNADLANNELGPIRMDTPGNAEGNMDELFTLGCAGANRYIGFNLRHTRENIEGAGTRVGNAPVQLKFRYTFDGNNAASRNNLDLITFICVERKLVIKNGRIFVSN